jgi:hypothetical protein
MMQDIVRILEEYSEFKMDLDNFLKRFEETYDVPLTIETITGQLNHMLILSGPDEFGRRTIELSALRIFANEVSKVLEEVGGSVMVSSLDAIYLQK